MAPMLSTPSVHEWNPSFDLKETVDAYVFKADVPGLRKDDLEITTTGDRIEIAGKRDMETETKYDKFYAYERQYGSFSRAFTLPDGGDVAHARSELKDGVLTLVVPKHIDAHPTKMPIAAAGTKSGCPGSRDPHVTRTLFLIIAPADGGDLRVRRFLVLVQPALDPER